MNFVFLKNFSKNTRWIGTKRRPYKRLEMELPQLVVYDAVEVMEAKEWFPTIQLGDPALFSTHMSVKY